MRVELYRHPTDEDWERCRFLALATMGRDHVKGIPTDEWKSRMLEARHSPIRTLMFTIVVHDVPSYVATHFARHKHLEPYIQSQRNDRQAEYDRTKAPQDAPVLMVLDVNAEELMTVANKRLCAKADPETQRVADLICQEVFKVNPEFMRFLVPACVQYGCHEFSPCDNGRIAQR